MPTLPAPGPESHQHRQLAESFGVNARRYDRARPGYPDALVARILAASPGTSVLDVGCGTGIAARLFQAAGCRVLGVEPDERMADLARSLGTEVEVSAFESWDLASRTFDAVIAGQAWHWIDPVAGAARAAQILRPGGLLAVFWNSLEPPPDLADAFVAVERRFRPDSPVARRGMPGPDAYAVLGARAADGMRQSGAFGDTEHCRFGWDQPYTRDEWLDLTATTAVNIQLPPDASDALLAATGAAIDAAGGSFTMHYTTVAVLAARSASA